MVLAFIDGVRSSCCQAASNCVSGLLVHRGIRRRHRRIVGVVMSTRKTKFAHRVREPKKNFKIYAEYHIRLVQTIVMTS